MTFKELTDAFTKFSEAYGAWVAKYPIAASILIAGIGAFLMAIVK